VTLQELCAARGLTLEQLSERAGIALPTLTKLDAGTTRANQFVVRRLADALRDELSASRRRRGRTPAGGGLSPWR
jgi:transcriptional regulator with XRE-family HTH domain